MMFLRKAASIFAGLALCVAGISLVLRSAAGQGAVSPIVAENAVKRVSEHSYVIMGFPNIGFVVGNRATLVIDTGMGARNGATVLREAQKLSKNAALYLTTTHFHPEHASGAQAFPPSTILLRPVIQQEEMDRLDMKYVELFRSRSALNKELLEDLKPRRADILFDPEMKLDLGGVTARLLWLGAAHTQGDELIFVEEDGTLFSGDVVQNKVAPNMPDEDANMKSWLAILDKLEPLKPRLIVPDHSAPGDASLIGQERAFLADLQGRALELKRQGKSAEEAGRMIMEEFKTKYPDWGSMNPLPNAVVRVYAESQ